MLATLALGLSACGPRYEECFAANECYDHCGGTMVQSGCDPCPADTISDYECRQAADGGSSN